MPSPHLHPFIALARQCRIPVHYALGSVTVMEYALVASGWLQLLPISLLLSLHVLAVIILSVSLYSTLQAGADIHRFPLLYGIFLIIAGPLALPLCLFLYGIYRSMRLYSSKQDAEPSASPIENADDVLNTANRITLGFEDTRVHENLESWHDMFYYGDFTIKQRILGRICRAYHPSYAALLKQALDDHDNAVRVVAATSFTKIEARYNQHIQTAKDARNDATLSPDGLVMADCQYASSCVDWACSGLLDAADKDIHIANALHAIIHHEEEQIILHMPLTDYITLLIECNEPEQALRILDEHPDQKSLQLKQLHLKALMQISNYEDVHDYYHGVMHPFLEDNFGPAIDPYAYSAFLNTPLYHNRTLQ